MIIQIKSGLATVIYQGDGSSTNYPFNFPLSSTASVGVQVTLVGEDITNTFTFSVDLSTKQVLFTVPPSSDMLVCIKRDTSVVSKKINFMDTSTLKSRDLEDDSLQAFHALQELVDIEDSLKDLSFNILGDAEDYKALRDAAMIDLEAARTGALTALNNLYTSVSSDLSSEAMGFISDITTLSGQTITDITQLGISLSSSLNQELVDAITDITTALNGALTLIDSKIQIVIELLEPIEALETQVATNTSNITSLDNATAIMETDISNLKLADISLGNRVTALEAKLNYDDLNKYRLTMDANGIFTEIQWTSGLNLRKKSVLSGTYPYYTTRTVTYYKADGVTTDGVFAFTLSYDGSGNIISEVL